MQWLLKLYGIFMEGLKGPGNTSVYIGEARHETTTLTLERSQIVLRITSRRIVYLTTYKRGWIRPLKRAIFEVEGRVISNTGEDIDPKYLERVVYPNLSSRGLLHTAYPHVRAIGAFLDRITAKADSTVVLA